jgi:Breast carcinoma amplified sequence 2 (BCAS2)
VLIKDCDRRLRAADVRITVINQRRKLLQEKARGDLERLEATYTSLVAKNVSIEVACRKLEAEVAAAEGAVAAGAGAANGAAAASEAHHDPVPGVQEGHGAATNGAAQHAAAAASSQDVAGAGADVAMADADGDAG